MDIAPKEREILDILQEDFPLTETPFAQISSLLEMGEGELLEKIRDLKERKIIRRIGPIYDTKKLGYESSLVAFALPDERIEEAAEIINSHPGVSHNYKRNHEFNLWFTLAVPPDSKLGLEKTIEFLAGETQAKKSAVLETLKLFKLRVRLNMKGEKRSREKIVKKKKPKEILPAVERHFVLLTQEDLPLVSRPFDLYAEKLKLTPGRVVEKLEHLRQAGYMRRFSALLHHRRAGFRANGMTVWKIDPEKVDEVGKHLASYPDVSHAYERRTSPDWTYNVFAMVHKKSKEEVEKWVKEVQKELNIEDKRVFTLYSSRQFKKKRLQYFTEDYYQWEEKAIRKIGHTRPCNR